MSAFTDHSHSVFQKDLRDSFEAVKLVAKWLSQWYEIDPLIPPIVTPHQSQWRRFSDSGDIRGTRRSTGEVHLFEAKGLNYHFTCEADWPHRGPDGRKRVFVGGVSKTRRMNRRTNTKLIIQLNKNRTHMVILDPRRHAEWTTDVVYIEKEKRHSKTFIADISLARFFTFPPPKGVRLL